MYFCVVQKQCRPKRPTEFKSSPETLGTTLLTKECIKIGENKEKPNMYVKK